MSTLRIVLDANVWVSGFLFPGGTPNLIVEMVIKRDALSIHSDAIVEEVLRNVRKVGESESDVGNALLVIQQFSTLVEPEAVVTQITGKDSDNGILECAVAADADMIVSGDKRHLLSLGGPRAFRFSRHETPTSGFSPRGRSNESAMRESQTQDSPDHDLASLFTEEAFKGQEIIRFNAADSRAFVDALLRDSEPHERL